MSENESYIVKKRDLAEIIQLQDKGAIEEFMKDPLSVIAGAVNEYLLHPSVFASTGVRIAHSILKAKIFEQLATEVKHLRERGKLPADFAEKKYGYQSWVDLLKIIDDEAPDEDRLEALKAMFYASNKVNLNDVERIVGYQLFQIAKSLSSNHLMVLRAAYRLMQNGTRVSNLGASPSYRDWSNVVAEFSGHYIANLVEHADPLLVQNQLFHARIPPDLLRVVANRLTELGVAFCKNIDTYKIETKNA